MTASGETIRRPRRRISVAGVLGELLITAGALVLAFLGYQVWLADLIVGGQLNSEASELAEEWGVGYSDVPPSEAGDPTQSEDPPVQTAPGNAIRFATLIIPRFGGDYNRPIAEGVGTTDVLNKGNIGHYPTTQMPGALGNFALASHRSSGGGNFRDLHQLRVGDHIYVETPDGWYQYSFRNLEYVRPSGVGVLNPVPQVTGAQATERYITLTTCNPFFSTAERIIAYGVYDSFYPRAGGVPAEIASNVTGAG
ncbi:class E sortase [Pseudolysinimonas yzui]|uniref:Class E sortase n=1 Tax=Pseudolysinimonas yzui TaxID=2708254 RepID=A0A8J3GS71_9MICO|nr:class E sortase [Pseudolysinimonas yzui]GHF21350.1 class E sortase [Pseudolysinimonas yzui]